jgi:low affinity Fe/Cu permease
MGKLFTRVVDWLIHVLGSPAAVLLSFAVIVVWVVSGPFFGFSDTWQLVINTGTTIITFLMVFVIQNSQNRDSKAVHIKLDELIRSIETARDEEIEAEYETEAEQNREIEAMREEARAKGREPA